jgi:ribosomal protein S18 acetylase RimI-like enzyme
LSKQGIFSQTSLTEEEIREIQRLVETCNRHDGILLRQNWDMLSKRTGTHPEDFLYFDNGRLVGYLALYSFHGGEAEFSGMVHPDYRRRGIFRQLVQLAEAECKRRAIPQALFIVDSRSPSGKGFVETAGAAYSFSEYWMELGAAKEQPQITGLRLRPAVQEDRDMLIQLNIRGFHMQEEHARQMTDELAAASNRPTYLALMEDVVVGKVSVLHQGGDAIIYGFTVDPVYQGKGYGRRILAQLIGILRQQGSSTISLEVACENSRALGLYESCGFSVISSNDYYKKRLCNDLTTGH